MIGSHLGHYRLVDKLGHGGMGEVYRAEDSKLKRQVALKVLTADVAGDPEAMARFRREAESVAALNHPNIVTIYSVEEDGGTHYLTMELVEGESLAHRIPSSGLGLERFFELAIPLADALSAAHERGIVHRDLKPANVMVTADGRVKVLDFGLAKLLEEPGGKSVGEEATQALTETGIVMGTVPYMSPEQVQGKPVDYRTDIFSLGVILYEMATGRRPFQGESSADLISSILRDTPQPVTEIKEELPFHLGRIVRHCLEKDPQRRYQSALDVRNELAALKREVDTGVVHSETAVRAAAAAPGKGGRPRWAIPAALLALVVVVGLSGWLMLGRGAEVKAPPPAATGAETDARPSVAVLYFDNLSGDEELEWLRSGLTDMLVTDLSQSPDLRVLSTNRLYQILAEMRQLDERITSFEVVQQIAQRAGAGKVILGSFAKVGETIRISMKIQEAASGEILQARSVDASLADDLFARIDELSRDIRRSIELPERPVVADDRSLKDVSTSSVLAYRHYVEAEKLHYQGREQEAAELYKKAVEEDPEFAMAWAKLATTHGNLQMIDASREYAEKAMEHLDRLTQPERAYVEGRYFGQSLPTYARAIETYVTILDRYPHLTALANNLAVLYSNVWMLREAAERYEQGIRYGDTFPGTYHGLAGAYLGLGESGRALALLDEFLERNPESFSTWSTKAGIHLAVGDLEEARAAYDRAEELQPGFIATLIGYYQLAYVEGDEEEAARWADRFGALPFPFAQAANKGLRANLALDRGRAAEALELVDESIAVQTAPGATRAGTHLQACVLGLFLDDPESALEHARQARADDPGSVTELVAHALEAVARLQLGQERRAELLLEELIQRVEGIPGVVDDFVVGEVKGRFALARGDTATAIRELQRAAAIPPSLDLNRPRLLYALAEAHLAAGQDGDAERLFRQLLDTDLYRFQPFVYNRAFYQLGRLLEKRGEVAGARRWYGEFVERWGDGDVDREEIEHAREYLRANAA